MVGTFGASGSAVGTSAGADRNSTMGAVISLVSTGIYLRNCWKYELAFLCHVLGLGCSQKHFV